MKSSLLRIVAGAALTLTLAGCAGRSVLGSPDGSDGAADITAPDVALDAPLDAQPDTRPDVAPDELDVATDDGALDANDEATPDAIDESATDDGGDGGDDVVSDDADDTGVCVPQPEVCNGIDDNCNGQTDEAQAMMTCGVGECTVTMSSCINGVPHTCTPNPPSTEVCNGLDDDCNGQTDEGMPDMTCGSGVCARTVRACINGVPQTCTAGNGAPEVCNGVDDNCNGMTDEGMADLTCGRGACTVTVPACVNGTRTTCTPGTPTAEVCNGVDDNCNGSTDEAMTPLRCGIGACATTAPACVNGMPGTCTPGMPGIETCNAVDDNCNGMTDEGIPDVTCGVGSCSVTIVACRNGVAQNCTPNPPGLEVCNGLDDNCNELTDEGDPGGGLSCATGRPGVCSVGVRHCVSGTPTCVPNFTGNDAEVCDARDNNCNGQVDEGDPGGGGPCVVTGQLGHCAQGVLHCTGGTVTCQQQFFSVGETCNGVDDNCNGITDDVVPATLTCGSGVCMVTVPACVNGVAQTCTGGGGSAESCNGIDDNCNGQTDEGTASTLCPPPSAGTVTACTAGRCALASCPPGTYDLDSNYSNGCECADDMTNATTCGAATNLGTIRTGQMAMSGVGKIPSTDGEDWFQVAFPIAPVSPLTNGDGQPTITFATNTGLEFRFEVRTQAGGCPGSVLPCPASMSGASNLTSWTFNDTCDPAMGCLTRNTPWPSPLYIRVYRALPTATCDTYQLKVSR